MRNDWSIIIRILLFILLLITYYYVRINFRFTSFMREGFFPYSLFRNLNVICIIREQKIIWPVLANSEIS